MAFSNFVALAIMVTTAATLHSSRHHRHRKLGQAAEALRPVAGRFAFMLFTLGIVGTGLLAVPVLAGSAAYALGEACTGRSAWRASRGSEGLLRNRCGRDLLGMALNFSPINPIKALFWSAVINGVVAVPVMAIMMLMSSSERVMGKFKIAGPAAVSWLDDSGSDGAVRRGNDGDAIHLKPAFLPCQAPSASRPTGARGFSRARTCRRKR